jgi:hypothetical protein
MARWQLQQLDAARAALVSGNEVMEREFPTLATDKLDPAWFNWIDAHVLHREACLLIDGKAPSDPFKTSRETQVEARGP